MALIERIQSVVKQQEELLAELSPLVQSAAECYMTGQIKLATIKTGNPGYGYPSDPRIEYRWRLSSEYKVYLKWNETWNYGGKDSGSFELSWDFVFDPSLQTKYSEDIEEQIKVILTQKQERETKEKLRLFNQLKIELESKNG